MLNLNVSHFVKLCELMAPGISITRIGANQTSSSECLVMVCARSGEREESEIMTFNCSRDANKQLEELAYKICQLFKPMPFTFSPEGNVQAEIYNAYKIYKTLLTAGINTIDKDFASRKTRLAQAISQYA